MQYDMIIIGGGLVGASLALALADTKLRIAVVEAMEENNDDPRLFALNDSSCQLLKNIHVWSDLSAHACALHEVHVTHRGHFGSVKLRNTEVDLASLGYVIPAKQIEKTFALRLRTASNVTVYQPATFKQLIVDNNNLATITIEIKNEIKKLHAPIIIAADGTHSAVRSQLNIPTETIDYQQSAIVTRVSLQRSHQHIAHERFVSDGAIAMLPLLDNECACIWSGKHETIAQLMQLDEHEFLLQLQTQFGYRLGKFTKIKQRFFFPLRGMKVEKKVHGPVFLLGNAAHTLHPIAAQGFNLALYEVAMLVEDIKKKILTDERINTQDLQKISNETQTHSQKSMKLSHRLASFSNNPSWLMNMIFNFGMASLDIATPFKLKFIREIMGKTNRSPRLLSKASEF